MDRMDRVADFLSEKTPRRLLSLCAFVGILYVFRHLAILVVFFVSFERGLTWCARHVATRMGLTRKKSVLIVLAVIVVVLGLLSWLGIGRSIRTFGVMHETFPAKLATLRENPLVERIEDQIGGTEVIIEKAKHYAGHAVEAATAVGHFLVFILICAIVSRFRRRGTMYQRGGRGYYSSWGTPWFSGGFSSGGGGSFSGGSSSGGFSGGGGDSGGGGASGSW